MYFCFSKNIIRKLFIDLMYQLMNKGYMIKLWMILLKLVIRLPCNTFAQFKIFLKNRLIIFKINIKNKQKVAIKIFNSLTLMVLEPWEFNNFNYPNLIEFHKAIFIKINIIINLFIFFFFWILKKLYN